MANTDASFGFTPIGTKSGSPWNGYIRMYEADTDASDIFIGDAVVLESDGQVDVAGAGTGNELLGVCVGTPNHMPVYTNGKQDNFLSSNSPTLVPSYSSAKGMIAVCIGIDVLYKAQEDGDTTALTFGDIGTNVALIGTNSGSTTTGRSGMELDSSSSATTTNQFRIVGFYDSPDNELASVDTTLPWGKWIVSINESHFSVIDTTTSNADQGPSGV